MPNSPGHLLSGSPAPASAAAPALSQSPAPASAPASASPPAAASSSNINVLSVRRSEKGLWRRDNGLPQLPEEEGKEGFIAEMMRLKGEENKATAAAKQQQQQQPMGLSPVSSGSSGSEADNSRSPSPSGGSGSDAVSEEQMDTDSDGGVSPQPNKKITVIDLTGDDERAIDFWQANEMWRQHLANLKKP